MSHGNVMELVAPTADATELSAAPAWHVLWTRSHCEALVRDQLAAGGFEVFLPLMEIWSRRGTLRRVTPVPLFPGYLFLHHALDKASDVQVRKARGLVTILGDRWDERAVVPSHEIDAIRAIVASSVPVFVHPYVREGQRVRITRGPLSDVEGLLIRTKPTKGLLVVSVELLRRSIAVEVDCTLVAAV